MLTIHYPPFRADDDDEFLEMTVIGIRAYAEELCGFSHETLKRAWRCVIKEHKTERWPVLGTILEACEAVPQPGQSSGRNAGDGYMPASTEEQAMFAALGMTRSMIRPSERFDLRERYRKRTGRVGPNESSPYREQNELGDDARDR